MFVNVQNYGGVSKRDDDHSVRLSVVQRSRGIVYIACEARGPEDADLSTCKMLEPMTTKTKNPSITGPTLKSFFFALPESTKPRRWMFPWNFRDLCAIMRCETACARAIHRQCRKPGRSNAIATRSRARARATRVQPRATRRVMSFLRTIFVPSDSVREHGVRARRRVRP